MKVILEVLAASLVLKYSLAQEIFDVHSFEMVASQQENNCIHLENRLIKPDLDYPFKVSLLAKRVRNQDLEYFEDTWYDTKISWRISQDFISDNCQLDSHDKSIVVCKRKVCDLDPLTVYKFKAKLDEANSIKLNNEKYILGNEGFQTLYSGESNEIFTITKGLVLEPYKPTILSIQDKYFLLNCTLESFASPLNFHNLNFKVLVEFIHENMNTLVLKLPIQQDDSTPGKYISIPIIQSFPGDQISFNYTVLQTKKVCICLMLHNIEMNTKYRFRIRLQDSDGLLDTSWSRFTDNVVSVKNTSSNILPPLMQPKVTSKKILKANSVHLRILPTEYATDYYVEVQEQLYNESLDEYVSLNRGSWMPANVSLIFPRLRNTEIQKKFNQVSLVDELPQGMILSLEVRCPIGVVDRIIHSSLALTTYLPNLGHKIHELDVFPVCWPEYKAFNVEKEYFDILSLIDVIALVLQGVSITHSPHKLYPDVQIYFKYWIDPVNFPSIEFKDKYVNIEGGIYLVKDVLVFDVFAKSNFGQSAYKNMQPKQPLLIRITSLYPSKNYIFRVTSTNQYNAQVPASTSPVSNLITTGAIYEPNKTCDQVSYELSIKLKCTPKEIIRTINVPYFHNQFALYFDYLDFPDEFFIAPWKPVPELETKQPPRNYQYDDKLNLRRVKNFQKHPGQREGECICFVSNQHYSQDPFTGDRNNRRPGYLFLHGGVQASSGLLMNDIWIYDFATRYWEKYEEGVDIDLLGLPSITKKTGHKCSSYKNSIFIVSTNSDSFGYNVLVEQLELPIFTWERFQTSMVPRVPPEEHKTISDSYEHIRIISFSETYPTRGDVCVNEIEIEISFQHTCLHQLEIHFLPGQNNRLSRNHNFKPFRRGSDELHYPLFMQNYDPEKVCKSTKGTSVIIRFADHYQETSDVVEYLPDKSIFEINPKTKFKTFSKRSLASPWKIGFYHRFKQDSNLTVDYVDIFFNTYKCNKTLALTKKSSFYSSDPIAQIYAISTLELFLVSNDWQHALIYNMNTSVLLKKQMRFSNQGHYVNDFKKYLMNSSNVLVLSKGIMTTRSTYNFRADLHFLEFDLYSVYDNSLQKYKIESEFHLPHQNIALTSFTTLPFSGKYNKTFTQEYIALYGGKDSVAHRTALRIAQLADNRVAPQEDIKIDFSDRIRICTEKYQRLNISDLIIEDLFGYLCCRKLTLL